MAKKNNGASGEYDVGYGKPPEHTRFKKGRSGNPKGRPKGSKNSDAVFVAILGEKVSVREGDRTRTMSKMEVMAYSTVAKAMKGDIRAVRMVTDKLERYEQKQAANDGPGCHPVLVVPGMASQEDWEKMVKEQQARYAGNTGEDEA